MKEKPKSKGAMFTREGVVEIVTRAAEGDKPAEKAVRLSVSSEEPYLKWCWDEEAKDYVRAYEVLGHGPDEIDFSRMKSGLVIQDGHYGKQIGIMDAPEVKDGKLCGEVRFGHSQDAQDAKADALDGIRRNMSVGYIVEGYKRDGERDGYPVFRAVKWTPFEGSFVNVPADPTVGVGRSRENDDGELPSTTQTPKEKSMKEEEVKAVVEAAVKSATDATNAKVEKIEAQVRELAERKPETPAPAAVRAFDDAQTKIVAKRYSLARAVMGMAEPQKYDNGFERECSEQIASATHKSATGLFVPEFALRTWTGKTNVASHITGAGANAVATELLASQYIDALVAETVLGKAGVQTMAGLVGDIDIPTVSAVSAGWQSAEDGEATTVTPTFSKISGTPHTVTGTAIVSRKLCIQSSIGVDALLSRLVTEAIGRAIETAAFDGSGSGGQPTGLANISGMPTVSMTADAPTKANMVDFWKTVLAANAGTDSLKYIMSPAVKALLCKTMDIQLVKNAAKSENVGGVGGGYLCDRESKIEGYDVLTSGLCNAKKIYFGNWSDLILAFWTGIDLIVDPYTYSSKGGLQLSAFQDCDILCRHAASFAIGTALS